MAKTKAPTYITLLVEVPVSAPPARQTTVNINDDISIDIRLDQRQSAALRHLFAGLQQSMKYQLFRPAMGLVWFLEQVAAQLEEKHV